MKQCKKCAWYDEIQDTLMIRGDDDLDEDHSYEHHYCGVYDNYGNHIPQDILNDKKKCDDFYDKSHFDWARRL